ncbi:MAG: alkaline phosphatase family protein [Actinomycetota bacterium]
MTPRHHRTLFRRRRRRILPAAVTALLLTGGVAGGYLLVKDDDPTIDSGQHERLVAPQKMCEVPLPILERVANGYVPGRSGDVLAVEETTAQFNTRHSSPHPYTQDVPLVLYGPGFIKSGVSPKREVTVADLAPTYAELMDYSAWPEERDGRVLEEALLPEEDRNGTPKLIFTLVWDGGGDNVLEQWPDAWPQLRRLLTRGTGYDRATVGSTPSITPAIHATIGTGTFPSTHGIPDTRIRVKGEMLDAWEGTSPRRLRVKTLGDLWDAANDNAPLVGMMARDAWHLGMIGHGAYLPEGDNDIAAMDDFGGVVFRTNEEYYSLPGYLLNTEGLEEAVQEVDARDGETDQRWLGNPILSYDAGVRYTPAWSIYQTQRLSQLLETEGYGRDEITDLFYANYKAIDLAGHTWNMVEAEVKENVEESDRQLGAIIDELDRLVGKNNYVLALTADHGMTPFPEAAGNWSINMREMSADIEKRFDSTTPNIPLILSNRGYQLMLNQNELKRNDITAADVARFLSDYRVEDNMTTNDLPEYFEGRGKERLFMFAATGDDVDDAIVCSREETAYLLREERLLSTRHRNNGLPTR